MRCDYGMENYNVAASMINNRGPGRGSIITGSSAHNSRVERTHRYVYSGVLTFYARIFGELEDKGSVDVLNDVHMLSLHHIYIPRIEISVQELVRQMNNRPVSTERNQSPLQMWEKGMLENLLSGHTALELNEADIEQFGVDPDSVLAVEDDDNQVDLSPPSVSLPDSQVAQLPLPLANDRRNGKALYIQYIEVVSNFLTSHSVPRSLK